MHRAILTLVVGLMLSLGGGASALTFKSDGSVVQKDEGSSPNKLAEADYLGEDLLQEFVFGSLMFLCERLETGRIKSKFEFKFVATKDFIIGYPSRKRTKFDTWAAFGYGKKTNRENALKIRVIEAGKVKGKNRYWSREFEFFAEEGNDFISSIRSSSFTGQQVFQSWNGKKRYGNCTSQAQVDSELLETPSIEGINAKIKILKQAEKSQQNSIQALKDFKYGKSIEALDLSKSLILYQTALTQLMESLPQEYLVDDGQLEAKADYLPKSYEIEANKYEFGFASRNIGGQKPKIVAAENNLAELEKERKAKQAETWRLAKLEAERKAKEAEARRLAKLEEERKAKQAETRRLAKLEEERKAKEAEARLVAKLEEERKAEEAEARRLAEADKFPPKIFAEVVSQDGYDALIRGVITDDTGLQDIAMNGQLLDLDGFGAFEESIYIPRGGKLVTIEAIDKLGKLARFELKLERQELAKLNLASFEELKPSKRIASPNDNAVAIIIGIAQYQRTEVPAIYADQDANYFYDYAALKLGVPERNIIDLVNENANAVEIFLATENFLRRKIQKDKTDVFIFYAGHGLATDDGSEMYLLPYDGAPQLLERTAISRKQLFNDIAASNPQSVTVFLDTCYSGTTRGTETLIASRPIAIKAKQQDIPDGFTVMTAAAGDQTAKPLEEAKHGMFSYFLMKGMEGDADANQDNQITASELHAYVQQNVIQQSSGSQTPELQGDAERVLVRFQ